MRAGAMIPKPEISAVDRLRRLERGHGPGLRPAGHANRQGQGHARRDGGMMARATTPEKGANCAWVLPYGGHTHALHYHQVDVGAAGRLQSAPPRPSKPFCLRPSSGTGLSAPKSASGSSTQRAGHPRLRGALGRTGRGLLQGADINDVGLMEDRATLRIQPAYCQLAAPRPRG